MVKVLDITSEICLEEMFKVLKKEEKSYGSETWICILKEGRNFEKE